MSGKLSIVPTPIGNLADMTFRGVDVLKDADVIAAEDTRRTALLLKAYSINTPLISYHEHNESKRAPELIKRLLSGDHVALVSNAGTPVVSDPGYRLVSAAIKEGVELTALPGASALLPALLLSGISPHAFLFVGFLPRKSGERKKRLLEIKDHAHTIIFFESPNRVRGTLEECRLLLGDREVAICRELTKKFEEVMRGKISTLIESMPTKLRGEITVVLAPENGDVEKEENIDDLICSMLSEGKGVKEIARSLYKSTGIPKQKIYAMAVKIKSSEE